MSRLPPLRPEELRPDQREQHEALAETRPVDENGQFGGPFDVWIRSPEIARRMLSIGGFLRQRATLGRRPVEVAILVTGRFWRSDFEWWAHARLARESGVDDATIEAIFEQRRPDGALPAELVAHDVARALHETHELPREVYDAAVAEVGEEGLVEIIATIGYYTFVSMTLNAFAVSVPPGVEPPFPRPEAG